MKPRNKAMGFIGVAMLWLGIFYTINTYGWLYLIPYMVTWFVFTAFIGVPAAINIIRCRSAYAGQRWHFTFSVLMQLVLAVFMALILNVLGMKSLIILFVCLGVVKAFAMPREQLMQERLEYNIAQEAKRAAARAIIQRRDDDGSFQ